MRQARATRHPDAPLACAGKRVEVKRAIPQERMAESDGDNAPGVLGANGFIKTPRGGRPLPHFSGSASSMTSGSMPAQGSLQKSYSTGVSSVGSLQMENSQTGLDAALSAANSVLSSAAMAEPLPAMHAEHHVPSGLLSAFSNPSSFSSATESLRTGSRAGYGTKQDGQEQPSTHSSGLTPSTQEALQQQQETLQQQQEIIKLQAQLLRQTQSQQHLLKMQHHQEQQQLIQAQQQQLQQLQQVQRQQTQVGQQPQSPSAEEGEATQTSTNGAHTLSQSMSGLTMSEEPISGLPSLPSSGSLPAANSSSALSGQGSTSSLPTASLPTSGRLPGFDIPSSFN